MKKQNITFRSLSDYVDDLQSRGEYVFTQKEAKEALGCSDWAIRLAANRLMLKKRIVKLRYAFYLIVPLEYKSVGAPPPAWYIDVLMQYHQQPYYVALLSAAALHGAAHQQPQVFQVMTNTPLRPIKVGRAKIQFLVKKDIEKCAIIKMPTETGYMNVSTPEVTAFDLVRYMRQSGSLSHVATLLAELSEVINPEKLVEAAKNEKAVVARRTGYLLEKYGKKKTTELLRSCLSKQKSRFLLLGAGKRSRAVSKNKNWRMLINKKIEADVV